MTPDEVDGGAGDGRLFTQDEVNQIVARRLDGLPTRREYARLREDVDRWRDRAMRNKGEIEALQRILDAGGLTR